MNAPGVSQDELEEALRRYFAKMASRYAPFLIGLLAIVLIVVLVPTTQPSSSTTSFAGANAPFGTNAAPGSVGSGVNSATGTNNAGTLPNGGTTGATYGSGPTGGVSTAGGVLPTPSGITAPAAAGTSGQTVNGVACGPGVRQLPFSKYSPLCVPAYHGDNGGATAPGVTGTAITLSLRVPNSAQQSAINALAGAANVDNSAYIKDLQSYIAFFNTQFELYGRHVVLKTYQGQGDYLEEDQGQGLGATQADAVTAHDLGAFGDVTFPLYSSQYYYQDVANEHVIGFGAVYLPNSWFDQYAPYEYSVFSPTGTNAALAAINAICRRGAGMPAIYTNDPLYSHENRVYGLIIPDNGVYQVTAKLIRQGLANCGIHLAAQVNYSINVAAFESESVSAVAQMKAAGVTTVICSCDPLVPIFISQAADQQKYFPEWLPIWWNDPATRNFASDQWDHAITTTALGGQWPPVTQTEFYRAFQIAYPGKQPAETEPASPNYFYIPYYTLMNIFSALQAAGPNLNPSTFEQAMFSLPPSLPGGDVGTWTYGNGIFDPISAFNITKWSPTTTSNFDGKPGAWVYCNGGAHYPISDPNALGPHEQLDCPKS